MRWTTRIYVDRRRSPVQIGVEARIRVYVENELFTFMRENVHYCKFVCFVRIIRLMCFLTFIWIDYEYPMKIH